MVLVLLKREVYLAISLTSDSISSSRDSPLDGAENNFSPVYSSFSNVKLNMSSLITVNLRSSY